ncbi:unnamed protein product [Cylindrotheca closterium]|uniref:Peptidase A2 domain-containing protein n=1 Tax=Cylindrotheca closterium TaxID=2856 RepID=A0AAD2CQE9_9STRA|nr:unnamed protein product [Cylindrotheca closterium]
MGVYIVGWLSIYLSFLNDGTAFRAVPVSKQRSSSLLADSIQDFSLEEKIRATPAKQIKEELASFGVSTIGLFEKEDLVQRLLLEKIESVPTEYKEPSSNSLPSVISTPLYFTSLDAGLRIAAVNSDDGISVNPSEKPYAAIKVQVQEKGTSFSLQLLLDTACSGLVLRPSVVKKWNLPKSSMPVTMTGAGGSSVAQGLTQLSFDVGDKSFGPLPAAIQDIGALPRSLDGIVGLSFLQQFCSVDMDFAMGQLRLYDPDMPPPLIDSANGTLVGNAKMCMIPQLGLYAVDVYLGGRGPVKMLIDSGASFSALNWNGIDKLGISRDDESFLKRLGSPMCAMGSDSNVAQLTHRIHVSSVLQVGNKSRGLSLKHDKRLPIDIGNIAILDALASYNVVGILGIDALMKCSCVRLQLETEKMQLLLFE